MWSPKLKDYQSLDQLQLTHTHTHTHTQYIYIYMRLMSSSCNEIMYIFLLMWSIKYDFEAQAYPEVSIIFTAEDGKQYSS